MLIFFPNHEMLRDKAFVWGTVRRFLNLLRILHWKRMYKRGLRRRFDARCWEKNDIRRFYGRSLLREVSWESWMCLWVARMGVASPEKLNVFVDRKVTSLRWRSLVSDESIVGDTDDGVARHDTQIKSTIEACKEGRQIHNFSSWRYSPTPTPQCFVIRITSKQSRSLQGRVKTPQSRKKPHSPHPRNLTRITHNSGLQRRKSATWSSPPSPPSH